jgi:uncharacterized membrane protein YidH (DUF202 family)
MYGNTRKPFKTPTRERIETIASYIGVVCLVVGILSAFICLGTYFALDRYERNRSGMDPEEYEKVTKRTKTIQKASLIAMGVAIFILMIVFSIM